MYPGRLLWFRIYYVDAFYNRPASISKIAYVEILDKYNQPVLQQKVSLKPGESNGIIYYSCQYSFRRITGLGLIPTG